jgi:hypothetical protein
MSILRFVPMTDTFYELCSVKYLRYILWTRLFRNWTCFCQCKEDLFNRIYNSWDWLIFALPIGWPMTRLGLLRRSVGSWWWYIFHNSGYYPLFKTQGLGDWILRPYSSRTYSDATNRTERETSSIYWAKLSRYHLKTEREQAVRYCVLNERRELKYCRELW